MNGIVFNRVENATREDTREDTECLITWRLLACASVLLLFASACGGSDADAEGMPESANFQPSTQEQPNAGELESGITGVLVVPISSAEHVRYEVAYSTSPPAGGPHLPFWLNCGYYEVPVLNELAVHSLEHGAVWVTYRPGALEASDLESLAAMAAASTHLLVSPYSAQDTAIVLSAWGRQLPLQDITDERFGQFLDVYLKDGPTAPEPAAACQAGIGIPPDQPSVQAG